VGRRETRAKTGWPYADRADVEVFTKEGRSMGVTPSGPALYSRPAAPGAPDGSPLFESRSLTRAQTFDSALSAPPCAIRLRGDVFESAGRNRIAALQGLDKKGLTLHF
jgi:hypothetical protein